jgi:DNA replication protein DnaC
MLARSNWRETIADAILERIVYDVNRIELKGESLRKRKIKQTEIITVH